ncbi:MAG TPA: nucleotidyltransferase family protein [Candidatus Nanoarchaeia archaeon]|nr:nucleotidyltransferase family protein [Candidatus Nanoarchaeia archaeon]
MKIIIPAAGFGTRLHPLTVSTPKALLSFGEKRLLEYTLGQIEQIEGINEVLIVSNRLFYPQFSQWSRRFSYRFPVRIIDNGVVSEEQRRGSVGDLAFALSRCKDDDSFLVIMSDLFFTFSLNDIVRSFRARPRNLIGLYDVNTLEEAAKMGVVCLDVQNRVTSFFEKPDKAEGTIVSNGIFLFPSSLREIVEQYISLGTTQDRMGDFIAWLVMNEDVYGHQFSEGYWCDVGSIESYNYLQSILRTT